ncbi:UDP-N-acetylglucosamine 1-carboxyvinyltransferase [Marinobacter sp. HL-58]|uniref:UDP-N-acetylglucosamine 1-carboxyvinyltransferase n=1 Tax=Marinobacter sp. HL-58 TaxID=1479237 RepID=UPI000488F4A3|nr:UDP-N-acetylglucosamine 1-carboxyvinyltransferase [Marinobacter sp. HL-58]KPQ02361.1 MAG: UDP-N-acetylglucosamine 1-carboxyvinyltransferase [Marinobacter sp. HL-58]
MNKGLIVKKSSLEGVIEVSGAKNSVLKLLTASILSDDKIILNNYPSSLLDARIHIGMLEKLGKSCKLLDATTVTIEGANRLSNRLEWDDRSIRNTLLILGALTARTGAGAVPLPGGCQLGDRTFDLHEMVLRSMGAEIWQEGNMLCAKAPSGGLLGAEIHLPIRSTGATENAIISGSLAKGTTRIWNPHIRPEIIDLINFLQTMGAKIRMFGQEHIEVTGVEGLHGTRYTVMPDNMEAITWLVASVMTGGDLEIKNFPYADLEVAMIHLRESGAKFYRGEGSLIVRGGRCYPLEISTGPHPGINSDVQPILAAYAACAQGESRIIDLRFPGRYGYAEEMAKMGLGYEIKGNLLKVHGNQGSIIGAHVKALDLRAGAALALCGLVAEGETVIEDAWQIARGYADFDKKLKSLGADIKWMG